MHIPADWSATLGADFRGRVRYTRRFHRPTGLDAGERVFLVIERVNATGTAQLNGQRLGDVSRVGGPFRFEVTRQLQPSNLLTIDVELPRDDGRTAPPASQPLTGGLIGSVRLELETE
jgi:beta-galactosidase/beta-glucuronidase